MARRKKTMGSTDGSGSTFEVDHSIEEFADIVVESMRKDYQNELEPFEIYAQKLRSQVHVGAEEFRKRFSRGYHVLLEEITHPSSGHHSS